MRNTKNVAMAAFFLLFLGAGSAMADCTPEQIIEMYKKGLSEKLIKEVCGSSPQKGETCATEFGVCRLPAPAPVGTPCTCTNKYTGRSDRGTVKK